MVDSLWFVLALVLLAVVSVALVLVLVLRREEAHCGRATRTEYLQPNYGETGGFRVSSAPSAWMFSISTSCVTSSGRTT